MRVAFGQCSRTARVAVGAHALDLEQNDVGVRGVLGHLETVRRPDDEFLAGSVEPFAHARGDAALVLRGHEHGSARHDALPEGDEPRP
jgi:hypothetical protein